MTRKEAEEQGLRILDFDEALEIIAESEYNSVMENDLIWHIIRYGKNQYWFLNGSGINGMSREDVQDWFDGNDQIIFDWQLEDW